jgi:hypothetical protein
MMFSRVIRRQDKKMARKLAFRAIKGVDTGALVGVDGNLLAISAHAFEFDDAVNQGEQGIILAAADIVTRMDLRAMLTENYVAGFYVFAAELLTAKPLAIRITAVS